MKKERIVRCAYLHRINFLLIFGARKQAGISYHDCMSDTEFDTEIENRNTVKVMENILY
jgi:hypothetical protein